MNKTDDQFLPSWTSGRRAFSKSWGKEEGERDSASKEKHNCFPLPVLGLLAVALQIRVLKDELTRKKQSLLTHASSVHVRELRDE